MVDELHHLLALSEYEPDVIATPGEEVASACGRALLPMLESANECSAECPLLPSVSKGARNRSPVDQDRHFRMHQNLHGLAAEEER